MRVCRYRHGGTVQLGFYDEQGIVPVAVAFSLHTEATGEAQRPPDTTELIDLLPPDGEFHRTALQVADWVAGDPSRAESERLAISDVELLVPIPRPNKLILLAGNYAKHIEEGGGTAEKRDDTFPYLFMKPPSTTLTAPFQPVVIPKISPKHIDWELELAVVMGRRARHVREADALQFVGGYTIVNDISDREFRPNPSRQKRPRDAFFDWLHGKWHDASCPCGPCVATPATIHDPQDLNLRLTVNGDLHQDSSTAMQIFPVAAVIAFVSSIVTLEPGDIISTGTPDGVGRARGVYLRSGDVIQATISGIGTLESPVAAESASASQGRS